MQTINSITKNVFGVLVTLAFFATAGIAQATPLPPPVISLSVDAEIYPSAGYAYALARAGTSRGFNEAFAQTIISCSENVFEDAVNKCGASARATASYTYTDRVSLPSEFYDQTGLESSTLIPLKMVLWFSLLESSRSHSEAKVEFYTSSSGLQTVKRAGSGESHATLAFSVASGGTYSVSKYVETYIDRAIAEYPESSFAFVDPVVSVDPNWLYADLAADLITITESTAPMTSMTDGALPPSLVSVPEPATLTFFSFGLVGLAGLRRCKAVPGA